MFRRNYVKILGKSPETADNRSSGSGVVSTKTALTDLPVKEADKAMADPEFSKSPAFQFYPNNFTAGTLTLSTEEVGAYILLICHCWDHGHIPSDIRLLARITRLSTARMRAVWTSLERKFQAVEGGYIQPRLEREREKQADYRRRQSDAAAKRWDRRGNATASERHKPDESQKDALQSSVFSLQTSVLPPQRAEGEDVRTREASLSERAGEFCEWYGQTHERLIGVAYLGNPRGDYESALRLCEKFEDSVLKSAAIVWFGMDDEWAKKGTRTVSKFASRATDCVARMKARGLSA